MQIILKKRHSERQGGSNQNLITTLAFCFFVARSQIDAIPFRNLMYYSILGCSFHNMPSLELVGWWWWTSVFPKIEFLQLQARVEDGRITNFNKKLTQLK